VSVIFFYIEVVLFLKISRWQAGFFYLGVDDESILKSVGTGAFLHDIGKSKIDKNIILKSNKLTPLEWQEMKRHPLYGLEILKNEMGIVDPIVESIVINHHERIDGSGYPLHKKQLNKYDRIVAIIDAFDALSSERSYQKTKTPFDALKIMFKEEGQHYDKELLKNFTQMLGLR